MPNSRVTDGVRTRDNRNHNPLSELELRALTSIRCHKSVAGSLVRTGVVVPGPETSAEGRS
jgi:hypothetical protein